MVTRRLSLDSRETVQILDVLSLKDREKCGRGHDTDQLPLIVDDSDGRRPTREGFRRDVLLIVMWPDPRGLGIGKRLDASIARRAERVDQRNAAAQAVVSDAPIELRATLLGLPVVSGAMRGGTSCAAR